MIVPPVKVIARDNDNETVDDKKPILIRKKPVTAKKLITVTQTDAPSTTTSTTTPTTTTSTTPTTTTTEAATDCETVPVEWHGSNNSAVLYKSTSSRIVKVKVPTSDEYPTDIDSLYTGWIIFTKVSYDEL